MKEEDGDMFKLVNERTANVEWKISVIDEKVKIEITNPTELMTTRMKAKL